MLLAMPGMSDGNFERAVIAMCVHDEHGALGLNVGSVLAGFSFAELLASLDIDAPHLGHVPVLSGGPVDPQRGFVLHSRDWSGEGHMDIGAEWCLSGSLDVLRAIAEGRGPQRYIVTLGYSGWGAGQLEHEMAHQGWFLGGVIPERLAAIAPGRRWDECFAACGVDTRLLASDVGMA
jgi:putative transcriptional regulator